MGLHQKDGQYSILGHIFEEGHKCSKRLLRNSYRESKECYSGQSTRRVHDKGNFMKGYKLEVQCN